MSSKIRRRSLQAELARSRKALSRLVDGATLDAAISDHARGDHDDKAKMYDGKCIHCRTICQRMYRQERLDNAGTT